MKPYKLVLQLQLENDDQARRLLKGLLQNLEVMMPEARDKVVTSFEREDGASK